jgi:enoyl-CoA hydratase
MNWVRAEIKGDAGHIILNRPEKLNALTHEMYRDINKYLRAYAADNSVRVVVLSGTGRAFSAGFDLALETQLHDAEAKRAFVTEIANANRWLLWDMPKPTVALVHGYCLAGALELVLPTDFTICTDDCLFGEPEILFDEGPAFLMIPWLMGPKPAKRLLLGGETITGRLAQECGLVTASVPISEFDAVSQAWVNRLCKLTPSAFSSLKRAVNSSYEMRGMRASIDGWVEESLSGLNLSHETVGAEFARRVQSDGVQEAVRWRSRVFEGQED